MEYQMKNDNVIEGKNLRRKDFILLSHGARNIAEIFALHFAVFIWMIFAVRIFPLVPFIVLSLLIAAIQQRQLSEWLHEGLHFNIHPSKPVNEFVSAWLLGAFFGLPINSMRRAHFSHHAAHSFFDEGDADTAYAAIKPGTSVLKGFFMDLTGISAVRAYCGSILGRMKSGGKNEKNPNGWLISAMKEYIPVFSIQAILIATGFFTGYMYAWFLYYVALVTIYPVLSRLRLYSQHLKIDKNGCAVLTGSEITRTVDANIFERILFMSRLMQYHYEHHEIPSLPFRALQKMHKPVPDNPNRYTTTNTLVFKALAKGIKAA